ncbi:NADH:flavin oxidoreductase/NADH oxidase, partial [Pseudomonas syringae pv. tagetis]
NFPWGPAFMGPIAERVRRVADIQVTSVWGFGVPKLAEEAVKSGQLDVVSIGRAHLADPHWAFFAAKELGVEKSAWT